MLLRWYASSLSWDYEYENWTCKNLVVQPDNMKTLIGTAWRICLLLLAVQALGTVSAPGTTLRDSGLSAPEIRQIVQVVSESAFDIPDDWNIELRVQRVELGHYAGLVVQGQDRLCGATANCQIWVFRKVGTKWLPLFSRGEPPISDSFRFGPHRTNGVKDLMISTNLSARKSTSVTYVFDGRFYRKK